MFSFSRAGVVQTGTPGYAFVFDAMSGESYIFLRNLAVGSQSTVQLVANIFTHEVVARKLCNAETLMDWKQSWRAATDFLLNFPGSQVSQTLHIMYHAGAEPVSGTDRSDTDRSDTDISHTTTTEYSSSLPDFYIGDFGYARTASEARTDGAIFYGGGPRAAETTLLQQAGARVPDGGDFSPPPGAVPPTRRRTWDMARFLQGMDSLLVDLAVPDGDYYDMELAAGLQRLVAMLASVHAQEQLLAASNVHSRPPSLVEVVFEAEKLERAALAVEGGTDSFEVFIAASRAVAGDMGVEKVFVFGGDGKEMEVEVRRVRVRAEEYGKKAVEGLGSLVECVYCNKLVTTLRVH
ncbi:hypothetical protein N658DRAFT_556849 [Parathielavia hyrcaniae]|uniref:Uncharacterized protein n=1 Tax=Parathielavia hyrcaniae TaxID=113614 RepID=A0AAN6Q7R5_9PEZI|nr:hypothetical protein N658DRAFT_556849 [Parathielavia hyrcaniae]